MPLRRPRVAAALALTAAATTSAALSLPDRAERERVEATAPDQVEPVSARLHSAEPPPTTSTPSTTTTTAAPPPPAAAPSPPAPEPVEAPPDTAPPPATTAPAATPAALSADEARLLELANAERSRAGLPPLQADGRATALARDWSGSQASQDTLAHNPNLAADVSERVTPDWSVIGENVGVGGSADDIHAGFMASSAHRANIVEPDYDLVGIGVVRSDGRIWVTVVFIGF